MTGANADSASGDSAVVKEGSFEAPQAAEEALIGKVIGGRYEVGLLLGKGGFGSVFAATHITTGQRMVVKVLRAEMAADPTQVKRFFNEAKTTCQLNHPHTVRVFDFGRVDSGQLYMAMELLDGNELAVVLKKEAPLDPLRVTRITCAILKSLAEAHDVGLVHRDLKPGNVFLCNVHGNRDFVKLIDFGIAKSYEDGADDDLTKTGFAVGTPKYMSPEQCRAEPLDGRSDLYSLGVMMYVALTGKAPFKASSAMGLIVKHMQEPPPQIDEQVAKPLPAGLGEVVMRSLAKSPWDRFADADDMRASLEDVLAGAGQPVPPESRAISAHMRYVDPAALAAHQSESVTALAAAAAATAAKVESAGAATEALDTSEACAAPAAALGTKTGDTTQESAPDTIALSALAATAASDIMDDEEAAAMSQPSGVRIKLQRGLNQSSIVPSTPSRPSRNRLKHNERTRWSWGWLTPLLALVLVAGVAWLIWNVVEKRDVSIDLLRRQTIELAAEVSTKIREPIAAPKGQREVEMPRMKKGSVKKRLEYKEKMDERYEGLGGRGEPLSTKEIDSASKRVRRNMQTCLRRYGDRRRSYPSVSVAIKVAANGNVIEAVLDKEIGSGKLASCTKKAVRKMRLRGGRPGLESHMVYFGFGALHRVRRRPAKGKTLPKTKYNGDKAL